MSKDLRAIIFGLLGLLVIGGGAILLSGFQNAGNTGTFTGAQVAFINAGTTACSGVFNNIGQSSHYLQYVSTGESTNFVGAIDLEASFDSKDGVNGHWTQIALANLNLPQTQGGILQAGGYYQVVRSCVTVSSGTLSAWYSSSSGPVAFAAAATNSTGATSPVACDLSVEQGVSSGTTAQLISEGSLRLGVCQVAISFDGATTGGSVQLGFSDPPPAPNCTGFGPAWQVDTLASTPQFIPYGGTLGTFLKSPGPARGFCIANSSGAGLTITVSYARLP